jgi:hypothetical protein
MPDPGELVNEEAADKSRPRVLAVYPANRAEFVPSTTELRIQFDRPMEPLSLKLTWVNGGFLDCEFARYNSDKYEFSIPVKLPEGAMHHIVLNEPNSPDSREGFQSVDHRRAGKFAWRFSTKANPNPPEGTVPKAVSVLPPTRSETALFSTIEIQFDQPMMPPERAFPYLLSNDPFKRPELLASIDFDPKRNRFFLPIALPPKSDISFAVAGIRNASGVLADPVRLQYQTSEQLWSKAEKLKAEDGIKDPELLELLRRMQARRTDLRSVAETIQQLSLTQEEGLFVKMETTRTDFKWQQPNHFYGDVSGIMSLSSFRIGCDGKYWWHHVNTPKTNTLTLCPLNEMHLTNISICDPFRLMVTNAETVAAELGLHFLGHTNIGGQNIQLIEAWKVTKFSPTMSPSISRIQWGIDPTTLLVAQMDQRYINSVVRSRFIYDAINEPLPPEIFAPPFSAETLATPLPVLDANYTNRFLNLRDGSDGEMSLRWGKKGPKGRSSSGLN